MAREMVDFLVSLDLEGMDLLEVGGGIGAIQIEMIKRGGIKHAVNVELSAGYEDLAESLMETEGIGERVTRRTGDFVEDSADLPNADVLVMNRVVCCYPWMEKMMTAASEKAGRYLALTFPRNRWWVRSGQRIGNRFMAIRGCGFRAFVHDPAGIEAVARASGFVVRHSAHDLVWRALVMERQAA